MTILQIRRKKVIAGPDAITDEDVRAIRNLSELFLPESLDRFKLERNGEAVWFCDISNRGPFTNASSLINRQSLEAVAYTASGELIGLDSEWVDLIKNNFEAVKTIGDIMLERGGRWSILEFSKLIV